VWLASASQPLVENACFIEERNAACFIVMDANRFPVCYVYFESEPGRRVAANLMTRDEARRIASNIARLPDLLKRKG
jgi:hypothetical protein